MSESGKSPAVAWILWFFLGGFGAHRFYFGRKGSGAGMAGLWLGSMLTTPLGVGFLGFLGLTAWWVYDAFQVNKWLQNEPGAETQSSDLLHASPDTPPVAEFQDPMSPPTSKSEAA